MGRNKSKGKHFYRHKKNNLIMHAWDLILCASQFLSESLQKNIKKDDLGRLVSKYALVHQNGYDKQPYFNNVNFSPFKGHY